MFNQNKQYLIAGLVVLVSFVTVWFYFSNNNNFMGKVEELSDSYEIYQCKIAWRDWPAQLNARFINSNTDYEVSEAKDWIAFKSLLRKSVDDGFMVGLFYEEESKVIWFDTLTLKYYSTRYQYTTYFIQL